MTREERFKLVISQSALTQVEIAKKARISEGALSQWKSGTIKDVKVDPFFRFCKATNTSPLWLAEEKGPRNYDDFWNESGSPSKANNSLNSLINSITFLQENDYLSSTAIESLRHFLNTLAKEPSGKKRSIKHTHA